MLGANESLSEIELPRSVNCHVHVQVFLHTDMHFDVILDLLIEVHHVCVRSPCVKKVTRQR